MRKLLIMQYRWQVLKTLYGEDEWVDAEPPIDKKVLDLASEIIEMQHHVEYWENELEQFHQKAWEATGSKGDYAYPGIILMEIEGQAKERRLLASVLKEIINNNELSVETIKLMAEQALSQCLKIED